MIENAPDGRAARFPTTASSRAVTAFAALVAAAAPANAEEAVTALEPAPFLERFFDDNPRLEVLEARIDRARAGVVEAGRLDNPVLEAQREQVFPDGGSQSDDFVWLSWSVDISGARSRRVRAARRRVDATEARGDRDRTLAALDALELYYQAAHVRQRLSVLRDSREPLARVVDSLRERVARGDASGYDLRRLTLELAALDDRIAVAEIELAAARRRLGGLLGRPDQRFDAAAPLQLPVAPPPLGKLVGEAIDRRGDARAAAAEIRAADASLAAADRAWVPRLGLLGGVRVADTGTETATGYIAGLSLEIPLFRRGQAEAARARAHRRDAAATARALEREIPAAVGAARAVLTGRLARARTIRAEQRTGVDELVDDAEALYAAGEASVVELVDAYRLAVEVRLRDLRARWDARRAWLELWRAAGRIPGGER